MDLQIFLTPPGNYTALALAGLALLSLASGFDRLWTMAARRPTHVRRVARGTT